MKKWTIVLTVVFMTIVLTMPAHSGMKKLAQTGFQFLKIDVSPRAAAMGGAYLVAGFGADAMFYNPAGMARMNCSMDLMASQTRWIADISYDAFAIAKSLGNIGTVGISAMIADYGDIEGTMVANNSAGYINTGNVSVGAYVVGLSFARNLTNKFSVGGQVKWVNQNLGTSTLNDGVDVKNEVSGLAYDFGTVFYPGFKSFRFGMNIRNFSNEFKYQKEGFQLPLTFSIGIAMNLMDFMDTENHRLIFAVDAIHPRDYSERLNIGAEYTFMDMISLRAGYKYNYDEEGFTLGAGFHKSLAGVGLRVDYAYTPMDLFTTVNRIGVGISF
ncbi:PorV/PorQ family protein [bacterium]|nr:PorV/PorQ family protein [bacterium]